MRFLAKEAGGLVMQPDGEILHTSLLLTGEMKTCNRYQKISVFKDVENLSL